MSTATQRARRRQEREQTRAQILAAAEAFLEERSYRELSVNALMEHTGFSRSVFYRHFDDIPALLLALIAESSGDLVAMGEAWADSVVVTPFEARGRLAQWVELWATRGRVIHAVMEAARHDDAVEAARDALIEQFVALTARGIEARVEGGHFRTVDVTETARALILMLDSYLDDALGRRRDVDPERVLDVVATIWTATLFPEA